MSLNFIQYKGQMRPVADVIRLKAEETPVIETEADGTPKKSTKK